MFEWVLYPRRWHLMRDAKRKFDSSKKTTDAYCASSLRSLLVTLSPHELREFRRWIDQLEFLPRLAQQPPAGDFSPNSGILASLPILSRPPCLKELVSYALCTADCGTSVAILVSQSRGQAREIPKGLTADDAVLSSRTEHVDAYRSGSAFSMMKGVLECHPLRQACTSGRLLVEDRPQERMSCWEGCKLIITKLGRQVSNYHQIGPWLGLMNVSAIIYDAERNHSAKLHLISAFRLAFLAAIKLHDVSQMSVDDIEACKLV